jgi:hypothetical protein
MRTVREVGEEEREDRTGGRETRGERGRKGVASGWWEKGRGHSASAFIAKMWGRSMVGKGAWRGLSRRVKGVRFVPGRVTKGAQGGWIRSTSQSRDGSLLEGREMDLLTRDGLKEKALQIVSREQGMEKTWMRSGSYSSRKAQKASQKAKDEEGVANHEMERMERIWHRRPIV